MLCGLFDQRLLQRRQQLRDAVDLVAQPQAQVGRHLVVAAAAGVQLFSRVADQRGQPRFDVQVHVFECQLPVEAAGVDVGADLRQPAPDVGQVGRADDALRGQHLGMRQAAGDVGARQPLIEADAGGVALHQLAHRFAEQRRPAALLVGQRVG